MKQRTKELIMACDSEDEARGRWNTRAPSVKMVKNKCDGIDYYYASDNIYSTHLYRTGREAMDAFAKGDFIA